MTHNAPADMTGWRPVRDGDLTLYHVPDLGQKVKKITLVPELIETWASVDEPPKPMARVTAAASAAGWTYLVPRWSRWQLGGAEHETVSLSLVDPADGHVEAVGLWTDGRWDSGFHAAAGHFPRRIGYRQLRALADLPPGRYYEDSEETDD